MGLTALQEMQGMTGDDWYVLVWLLSQPPQHRRGLRTT